MVKTEELNRKRSSAKKKFDDEVKSFKFVLKARPEIHSLEEAFGEVKVKYKAVREIHDGITDLMVEADIEKADFTNHDIFVTELIAYGDLLSKLEEYRRKCEVDQTSKGLPTKMEPKQKGSNLERIKVKDAKSIRNLVATVRGFILRMEVVGASDEAKIRCVFADILAKMTVEDQRAYARNPKQVDNAGEVSTVLYSGIFSNCELLDRISIIKFIRPYRRTWRSSLISIIALQSGSYGTMTIQKNFISNFYQRCFGRTFFQVFYHGQKNCSSSGTSVAWLNALSLSSISSKTFITDQAS
ncbi:Hypothetical predicted protein, partial [Paramuricea clavata]